MEESHRPWNSRKWPGYFASKRQLYRFVPSAVACPGVNMTGNSSLSRTHFNTKVEAGNSKLETGNSRLSPVSSFQFRVSLFSVHMRFDQEKRDIAFVPDFG